MVCPANHERQFLDTPLYGVRQMTWHLQNEGHAVNEKRIRRLMRLMRLMPIRCPAGHCAAMSREGTRNPTPVARQRMLACVRGSKPAKGHKTYPYLLGGLRIDRPNQGLPLAHEDMRCRAAGAPTSPTCPLSADLRCKSPAGQRMRKGFLYLVAIPWPVGDCLQSP